MQKYYKAAKPRKEDKGSFGNRGQKAGTGQSAKNKVGSQKGAKFAKEKLRPLSPADAKIRKISKAMLASRKATSPEGMMRPQLHG